MTDFKDVLLLVAASIFATLVKDHYASGEIRLHPDELERLRDLAHCEAKALHASQP